MESIAKSLPSEKGPALCLEGSSRYGEILEVFFTYISSIALHTLCVENETQEAILSILGAAFRLFSAMQYDNGGSTCLV